MIEKYFPKFVRDEKKTTIPNSLKNNGLNIFQIAHKIHNKKIKLVAQKHDDEVAKK